MNISYVITVSFLDYFLGQGESIKIDLLFSAVTGGTDGVFCPGVIRRLSYKPVSLILRFTESCADQCYISTSPAVTWREKKRTVWFMMQTLMCLFNSALILLYVFVSSFVNKHIFGLNSVFSLQAVQQDLETFPGYVSWWSWICVEKMYMSAYVFVLKRSDFSNIFSRVTDCWCWIQCWWRWNLKSNSWPRLLLLWTFSLRSASGVSLFSAFVRGHQRDYWLP